MANGRYVARMTEFHIERLGHQGDGIAAGPVFAARTLPGDVVTGVLDGTRLNDIRIQSPSDDRVSPPCRHYKACGGCQLQHGSDSFVSEWKLEVVRQALAAHAIDTVFRPMHVSAAKTRRRAGLTARRTKKGAMAGFHARASDVVIEIPDCQLLHPDLMVAIPVAERLAIVGASRKGALSVMATLSEAGLDISVTGGKPLDGPFMAQLAQEAEANNLARLSWEGEVIAQRHAPTQRFGKAQVVPPPGAFLQATPDGEAALLGAVREIVGDAKSVADLFSGCGTFALPLAENAEVHAVEGARSMVDAMDQGWRRAVGLKKISHEARDLFRRPLMPDELKKFDAIVIDPPRAGAEAQVAEIAAAQTKGIAYVSCSPQSFARDAAALIAAGYSLDWVQVVDQFRWSTHIELAGCFSYTAL